MRRRRLAALAALALFAGVVANSADSATTPGTLHYTVEQGDTSWSAIVRKMCGGVSTQAAATAFSLAATGSNNGSVRVGQIIHINPALCPPPPTTTTSSTTTSTTTTTIAATTTTRPPTTTIPATTTTVTLPPVGALANCPNGGGGPILQVPQNLVTQCQPSGIPGPSDEGAFRLICMPSHLAWDDPVVYPNQPGASHLHQFFGNTGTNAASTFTSLRTTGGGTCQSMQLNRSGYWVPAMLDGRGNVVQPDIAVVYYKGGPNTQVLPDGLRYIAGDAMGAIPDSELYGSPNAGVVGGYEFHPYWECLSTAAKTETIPIFCANGQPANNGGIQVVIPFPWCWNGQLDSANHRAHVVFPKRSGGGLACPSSHPTEIPRFTFTVQYTVTPGDDLSQWKLSSDTMPGMTHAPGTTVHGDWFGAWEPTVKAMWTQECIVEVRNGNSANFCNGTIGRQPSPWYWTNPAHLVPIPPDPTP